MINFFHKMSSMEQLSGTAAQPPTARDTEASRLLRPTWDSSFPHVPYTAFQLVYPAASYF